MRALFQFIAPLVVALGLSQPALANDWMVIEHRGFTYHLLLDKKNERSDAVYRDAIANLCGANKEKHCILQFWTDRRLIPRIGGVSTDAQSAAMTVNYVNNPHTHFDKFTWNCRLRNDPDNCFRD